MISLLSVTFVLGIKWILNAHETVRNFLLKSWFRGLRRRAWLLLMQVSLTWWEILFRKVGTSSQGHVNKWLHHLASAQSCKCSCWCTMKILDCTHYLVSQMLQIWNVKDVLVLLILLCDVTFYCLHYVWGSMVWVRQQVNCDVWLIFASNCLTLF